VGERPEEIRRQIEETRAEMGETVEAIGYKADVPSRAKEMLSETKEQVTRRARSLGGTRGGGDTQPKVERAKSLAEENPLGLALGAAAAGFILGLLLPTTKVEDERVGPLVDKVSDAARDAASEAVERGKTVARETASSAAETARESVTREGEDLASSTQARAEEIRDEPPGQDSSSTT
jgi:ElaB/YqjD/DUF883 family membrane-anchored ribosome-binding protein